MSRDPITRNTLGPDCQRQYDEQMAARRSHLTLEQFVKLKTGKTSAPAQVRRGMNSWEQKHADWLKLEQYAGRVKSFAYESVKLRLANRTWYTPDFIVVKPDGGLEFHEVKGFWRDDARVKIKVAAEQIRWATFVVFTSPGDEPTCERIVP